MTSLFPPTERLPPISTNFSPTSSPSSSRRSSNSYHSPVLLTSQSNTTVLPPVSCIALSMPPFISPISTPSNGFPSPTPNFPPNTQSPSYAITKRASIDSFSHLPYSDAFSAPSHDQFPCSSVSPNCTLHSNGITHSTLPSVDGPLRPQQQYHHHHPYAHLYSPILSHSHQQSHPDPANELLAEKRRRNAGASARFRDRRKQRERDMQEKCQFLERRVHELESIESPKCMSEMEKKLEEAISDRNKAKRRIKELENEVQKLRHQLSEREREYEFLTPSSMSSLGDSDHKAYDVHSPSQSPEPLERVMKPTDVKSLLL